MKKRDEYVERMKRQLDEWNSDIDALERRIDQAEDKAEQRYEEQLRRLRSKRTAAEAELARIRGASGDSWEALKDGAERTWNELKSALKETKAAFSAGLERKGAGR